MKMTKSILDICVEKTVKKNGPFVLGGTYCTGGWNFADIFFSDNGKITRFYDFAGTSIALTPVHLLC